MKKILSLLALIVMPLVCFGQSGRDAKFDTNGPIGAVLFPEDENGDVVITEVITAGFKADTLKALAIEFLKGTDRSEDMNVSKIDEGLTKITADVEVREGTRIVELPAGPGIEKAKSTVDFKLVIDFRDGKYRYTLTNFHTDRWRIKGDGEDQGPSNRLHYQRVNSINKDIKRKNTRAEMLAEEEEAYQEEYKMVMKFVECLRTFAVIRDDF